MWKFCVRLIWMCSWCMWEKFIGICKLCFMAMAKFCGYVHGHIGGDGQILWVWNFWLMEKFCWVCDVDSWIICVVMILAMWEFICACICGNFYLFAWLWENFVYVKNFDCVEILVGHWFDLWWWGIGCENIYIYIYFFFFLYVNFWSYGFWSWKLML